VRGKALYPPALHRIFIFPWMEKVKISTVQTAMDGCLNGKRKGHKVFHAFFWDEKNGEAVDLKPVF